MKEFSRPRLLAGVLTAAVVAAVVIGMILIGSPTEQRAYRLDERRVRDMDDLSRAVDLYWTRHNRLPLSLGEIQREPGETVSARDPSTHAPYEYRPSRNATYDLCANFARDSGHAERWESIDFWSHGRGRQCFRREARKIR